MKALVGSFILAASAVFVSAQDKPVYTPEPQTAPQPHPQVQVVPAQAAKIVAELATRAPNGGVKNSPFSADEVNESVQTLADGNRIVRNTTGKIYRNSAGRVRRDVPGGMSGMMGTTYSVGSGVTLLDKVGGSFQLDNNLKIAQPLLVRPTPDVKIRELSEAQRAAIEKNQAIDLAEKAKVVEKIAIELDRVATTMPVPSVHPLPPMPPMGAVISGQGMATTILSAPGVNSKYESRTEELGTQNIEGVEAEGKRTITTIPAGAIGNERSIEIVYERWYSPELKMIVMSKRSDPRMGEQTYRLTNINRSEPDPSLFSVNGYRLVGPQRKQAAYATTTGEKGARKPAALPKNRFMPN